MRKTDEARARLQAARAHALSVPDEEKPKNALHPAEEAVIDAEINLGSAMWQDGLVTGSNSNGDEETDNG